MFGARPLDTPPQRDALEVLTRLQSGAFTGRIYLISKARERMQERIRQWLDHVDFFEITGIDRRDLIFVLTRPEKAPICARLGVTHFVDDQVAVMQLLQRVVPRLYLMTNDPLHRRAPYYEVIESWLALEEALVRSVST